MAKGSKIIASAEPRGHYEGIVTSGTIFPGTCVEVVPATEPVNGRFTYRNVTRAIGAIGPVAIMLGEDMEGFVEVQTPPVGVTTGKRARIYWPVAGEEFNMLLRESSGTGTSGSENIGDTLSVESTTGELIAGAGTSKPFLLMERLGLNVVDYYAFVKYLGNNV